MTTRRLTVAAVAVLALAGAACSSNGGDSASDGASTLEVIGTDALAFEPDTLTAPAGIVTIELTAEETSEHTFVVEELGDTEVVAAPAGETASGTEELEPGTYTFYCDVPGHRAAGMEGELTVE